MTPTLRIENLLWGQGVEHVAGIDEAGRGAWAGPVVAAAVILPRGADLLHRIAETLLQEASVGQGGRREGRGAAVVDSKELSPGQRAIADRAVRRVALGVGLGVAPARVVDDFGLSFAGQLAFWRAVRALPDPPSHLLVDGFPLWSPTYPQLAVIDGDARCLSIAAASIVAKVARDCIMRGLDCELPGYGFGRNAGYGTPEHRRALGSLGASPEHRRTYRPVLSVLGGLDE